MATYSPLNHIVRAGRYNQDRDISSLSRNFRTSSVMTKILTWDARLVVRSDEGNVLAATVGGPKGAGCVYM